MILSRPRALAIGALLIGAGGTVRAEESAAPLQESKQALRQLQKEQGQRATEGAGGLRGALPSINAPDLSGQGSEPVVPSSPRQQQQDDAARKQRAERNWLVDGMLRLEGKRPDSLLASEEDEEEKIDPSDPDFLLKTYMKEQRARKEIEKREPRDAAHANAAADPMAPFLREWLSGSPVEKAALGELANSPAGSSNSMGAAFPGERSTLPLSGVDQGGPAGERFLSSPETIPGGGESAAANPFLQGLELGSLPGAGGGPANLPGNAPSPGPPPPVTRPAPVVNPPPELPPPARQNDRKPPPSPLKENEKFFPQQKKF